MMTNNEPPKTKRKRRRKIRGKRNRQVKDVSTIRYSRFSTAATRPSIDENTIATNGSTITKSPTLGMGQRREYGPANLGQVGLRKTAGGRMAIGSTLISTLNSFVRNPFEMRNVYTRNKRKRHELARDSQLDHCGPRASGAERVYQISLIAFNLLAMIGAIVCTVFVDNIRERLQNQLGIGYRLLLADFDLFKYSYVLRTYTCVIAILFAFGAIGAFFEFGPLSATFGGYSIALAVITLCAFAYFGLTKAQIDAAIGPSFRFAIQNFWFDYRYAQALQLAQKYFECCGWESFEDYSRATQANRELLPGSCCDMNVTAANSASWAWNCSVRDVRFSDGCNRSAVWLRWQQTIQLVAVGSAFIQICLAAYAIFLGFKWL